MDDEDKLASNLETIYVHNVYENISSKYDEFFKLSCNQIKQNRNQNGLKTSSNENLATTATNSAIITETNNCSDENNNTITINSNNKNHVSSKYRYKLQQGSKQNTWPKVKQFLSQLDAYSLLADIGCGEGKYLNINSRIFPIGCDRSSSLSHIASHKYPPVSSLNNQNQILICDNLALPFKSDAFDAVVSIGVIHHLSTPKRRIRAVQELARILKPSGKIMIYVWAMEQRLRKFNSQDVLVPMLNTNSTPSSEAKFRLRRDLSNNSSVNSEDSNDESASERKLEMINKNSKAYTNEDIKHDLSLNLTSSHNANDENSPKDTNSKTEESNDESPNPNESDKSANDPKFDLELTNSSSSDDAFGEVKLDSSFTNGTKTNDESAKEIEDEDKEDKKTLIGNLKNFFNRRLSSVSSTSSKSSSKTLQHQHSNCSDSGRKPDKKTAFQKRHSNLYSYESLCKQNSIERYKKILEEHKDLLPENFTLRQFPYSSCPDTFDASQNEPEIKTECYKDLEENKEKEESKEESKDESKAFDLISVSSASLSPSPVNQFSPESSNSNFNSSNNGDMTSGNKNENSISGCNINNIANPLGRDLRNNSNKRFYHVFKQNELDRLIKENCPSLIIYDSFYDHGNWCICARKDGD